MTNICKKNISLLLVCCLIFTFTAFFAPIETKAALNISINGMFESVTSGIPSGWTQTSGQLDADSSDPYEGNYAMKVSGTTEFCASRNISLSANTTYMMSFAYKTSDEVTPLVKISSSDGNEILSQTFKKSTKWKTCQYEFTTPATISDFTLSFSATGSGDLYIDRLEMWQSEQLYGGEMENLNEWTFYLSNPGTTMTEEDVIKASLDTNGKTGSCIKIENTVVGANPYLWKNVGNIYGETVYQISADVKSTGLTDKGGVGFKISGFGDASNSMEHTIPDTGGEWQNISFNFTPVAGVNRIHVMPRLYGPGTAWFDNIHVRRVKNSESIISAPESLFFYSDEEIGTEYLNFIDNYAIAAGSKVRTKIYDGPFTVWENTCDSTQKLEIDFPLSVLTAPKKPTYTRDENNVITEIIPSPAISYTLVVEYVSAGGSVISSKYHTICKYDRPTYLTKNGDFVKNGEKVLPVVGYHAPYEDIPRLSEIGVTVIQSAASKSTAKIQQMLDEAQKYGVKVLVPLYEHMVPAGHELNIELTKQAIRMFHDHPALFGWMVQDEPRPASHETDEMYQLLQDSYNLIRSYDPDHPIYICECDSASLIESGQCCDILAVDPYPNELRLIENVYSMTVSAVQAVHGKKPIYNILQAWEWTGGWEPNADEIRNMAYLAMLGGAKGLGYYPVHDSAGNMFEQPLYEGAKLFAEKEQPVLLGNTFDVTTTTDAFIGKLQSGKNIYLLVASRADAEKTITFDAGVSGGLTTTYGGTATLNGTIVSATIPAHGAVLCCIDTSILVSNGSFEEVQSNGYPSGWSYTGGGENPGTTLFMDNTDPYDGDWCIKFDCAANKTINTSGTAKERLALQQYVPLTAGKTYRISYAGKVSSDSSTVPMFIRQNGAATPTFINYGVSLPSPNKWYEVVTYYTPATSGNALFFIGTYSAHWGNGAFYIDNFCVEEVTEPMVDFVNPDRDSSGLRVIETPVAGSKAASFAALPKSTDKALLVTASYVQKEGVLRLKGISVSSDVYSGANGQAANLAALLKTEEITVPSDATVVKTFLWSPYGMTPIGERKEVSFVQTVDTE